MTAKQIAEKREQMVAEKGVRPWKLQSACQILLVGCPHVRVAAKGEADSGEACANGE